MTKRSKLYFFRKLLIKNEDVFKQGFTHMVLFNEVKYHITNKGKVTLIKDKILI